MDIKQIHEKVTGIIGKMTHDEKTALLEEFAEQCFFCEDGNDYVRWVSEKLGIPEATQVR